MRRAAIGLTGFVIWATIGSAASPSFEVASIKVAKSREGVRGGCHGIDSKFQSGEMAPPPLGRCVITSGRLSHVINIAWGLNNMQLLKSGPDWIARGDDRFDIEAKAENPESVTEAELLEMLQNLLIERFHMTFHRETVENSGFALVVQKKGLKLKESTADEPKVSFSGGKPTPNRPVTLKARRCSMKTLANLLSQFGSGAVADQTGLTGEYDFELSWDEAAGPALTSALQDQLGLRLESRKVPVTYFVVDAAQKPDAN